MRLVSKASPHGGVRQLDQMEKDALLRYCVKGTAALRDDETVVKRILGEMRADGTPSLWLECDCRGSGYGGRQQPLLTTRSFGGRVHMLRLNQYGPHTCALDNFRSDPGEDAVHAGAYQPVRPIEDALDYLESSDDEANVTDGSVRVGVGEVEGKRLPKLGRVMHTILQQARFNVVEELVSKTVAPAAPWDRVMAFARQERLGEKLSLEQLLWTESWTKSADIMAAVEQLPWPAKKRKMGFLLFLADAIDGAVVSVRVAGTLRKLTLAQAPRIGGRDQRFSSPPYWLLIKVDRDAQGVARLGASFAQAAFSKVLPVPLDSEYERTTMALLVDRMAFLSRRGVGSRLIKPLFDHEDEVDGVTLVCRPDFELEVGPGRVVVETMGATDDEYLQRKAGTHAAMRRRGELLEHHCDAAAGQDERDEAFKKELTKVLIELAKKC